MIEKYNECQTVCLCDTDVEKYEQLSSWAAIKALLSSNGRVVISNQITECSIDD